MMESPVIGFAGSDKASPEQEPAKRAGFKRDKKQEDVPATDNDGWQ